MNKKALSILWLLTAYVASSLAADVMKVLPVTVELGKTVTISIDLDNETTNLMGWQCDISLPTGMTLKLKKNGNPEAILGNRFKETGHSISTSIVTDGYRFLATSMEGEEIPGNSGTLFTVTLICDNTVTPGQTYKGSVSGIKLNTTKNKKIELEDFQFDIVVPGGEKPAAIVTTAPEPLTLTYNGSEQELVSKGSAEGGTLQYSLDGTNYSTDVPNGKDAKTYTVYYKVEGDDNHNDVDAKTVTVTIGKAAAAVTVAPAALTLSYTGSEQELVSKGSAEGGTLLYSLDGTSYSTDVPKGRDAKTYTVYYKVEGDDNHNDVDAKTVTVTASKALLEVTAEDVSVDAGKPIVDDIFAMSFEYGELLWGWGDGYESGFVDDGSFDGSKCFYATSPTSGEDWTVQVAMGFNPLVVGQEYVLHFWAKATDSFNTTANVRYNDDAAGYPSRGDFGEIAFTKDWQEYTFTTTVTGEDANMLIINIGGLAGTVYFDNVSLTAKNPTLTLAYSGFMGDDNAETAFTMMPIVTTEATSESAGGDYPIYVSGGVSPNYELTYVDGTLHINAGLKGDVNQDGNVDVGDVMAVINIMAGQPGQLNAALGDVNEDGDVDVGDVMAIINIMAAH